MVEYDDHAVLPAWLVQFQQEVDKPRARTAAWQYCAKLAMPLADAPAPSDLEIIRGLLPQPDEPGRECLAVSCGETLETPWPGDEVHGLLRTVVGSRFLSHEELAPLTGSGRHVRQSGNSPVFYVVARDPQVRNRRDARVIADAMQELMTAATATGYHRVRCQLLATGSQEFPAITSLIEMIRGYDEWRRGAGGTQVGTPALAIHLVDGDVLFALATGRLDPLELLTCQDLRFWVEVVRDEEDSERHLLHMPRHTTVSQLATLLGLPTRGWRVDVYPRPRRDWRSPAWDEVWRTETPLTLATLGLLHGANLQFWRRRDGDESELPPRAPHQGHLAP